MADGGSKGAGMESFVPGPERARAFRDALGHYGTGVTVVTALGPRGKVAITANSFASVSLDPPLVLWSPAKSSSRHAAFVAAERFSVHVLDEHQEAMARHFATIGDDFGIFAHEEGPGGVPVLTECLARFDCRREAVHDAGDHSIVVGRVMRCAYRDGAPLMFLAGRYGRFTGAD